MAETYEVVNNLFSEQRQSDECAICILYDEEVLINLEPSEAKKPWW
jgi:hypothetical protein